MASQHTTKQKIKLFFQTVSSFFRHKNIALLLSFIIPAVIFASYFVFRGVFPFGKYSILTVDLGQQYVDFFAFMRENLFKKPGEFIYTFSKGLGGTMIGTYAYYLTSPINLLIFFFKKSMLPTAILLIITVKIGLIGLTSKYFFQQKYQFQNESISLLLSTSYALSGFVVAYNFNLMWLDSLILLPPLILAIDHFIQSAKNDKSSPTVTVPPIRRYLLLIILFITWFTNFYTGYMTILFASLYFLGQVILTKNSLRFWQTLLRYIYTNIIAILLNAALLVPTILELLSGKASAGFAKLNANFSIHPQNLLAKLFSGSYSFDEMSYGMPNFYFGAILFVFLLGYFFSKTIQLKEKVFSLILIAFLTLSFCFDPLILLWHTGQFPAWYPGRFSFVFSFFCLMLIAQQLAQAEKLNQKHIGTNRNKIVLILLTGIVTFVGSHLSAFAFLSQAKLFITIALFIVGWLYLTYFGQIKFFTPQLLCLLVILDISVNLVGGLEDISYQDNADYVNYVAEMKKATKNIVKRDNPSTSNRGKNLYRIEKDFSRSDDDALSVGYAGVGQFNSVIEGNQQQYLSQLGLTNNSNAFSYGFSTMVTDSLLGVKYLLYENYGYEGNKVLPEMDNLTYRPDFDLYERIATVGRIKVNRNPYALPFFYLTDSKLQQNTRSQSTGRMNQEMLLQQMRKIGGSYFTQLELPASELTNIRLVGEGHFRVLNDATAGKVTYTFNPLTNDPYYMSIPDWLNDEDVQITVNNHLINNSESANAPRLINIAANQQTTPIRITFSSKNLLNLNELYLYHLNIAEFSKTIKVLQKNAPTIHKISSTKLASGHFTLKKQKFLQSQIPIVEKSGYWQVTDNGKPLKTSANTIFLQVKLTKGKHHLKFQYKPTSLYLGIIISTLTFVLLLIIPVLAKKYCQNKRQPQ